MFSKLHDLSLHSYLFTANNVNSIEKLLYTSCTPHSITASFVSSFSDQETHTAQNPLLRKLSTWSIIKALSGLTTITRDNLVSSASNRLSLSQSDFLFSFECNARQGLNCSFPCGRVPRLTLPCVILYRCGLKLSTLHIGHCSRLAHKRHVPKYKTHDSCNLIGSAEILAELTKKLFIVTRPSVSHVSLICPSNHTPSIDGKEGLASETNKIHNIISILS